MAFWFQYFETAVTSCQLDYQFKSALLSKQQTPRPRPRLDLVSKPDPQKIKNEGRVSGVE